MLGSVEQKTEHRGWKPVSPHFSSLVERTERRRPNLVQRTIDGQLCGADQHVGSFGGIAALSLVSQRLSLRRAQLPAVRVRQQPIEASREVLQMEADRRRTARTRPKLLRRQCADSLELLADLKQRVRDRL